MNELFDALLDIAKLDAGALAPDLTEFPIEQLLKRTESTFAIAAREKGLRLRVLPSSAWVCSDFILLERILLNLVSNALRYASSGGVVVGCRRRAGTLRIEVCDSGPGIPEDQRQNIFADGCCVFRCGSRRRRLRCCCCFAPGSCCSCALSAARRCRAGAISSDRSSARCCGRS